MKMRKGERGSGMSQARCIRIISVVALMSALAACENAQEPTRQTREPIKQTQEPTKSAGQLKATKIGEVSDLAGPSSKQCAKPDGQKDQGIRLQIPPELGTKVSSVALFAYGKITGQWSSCSAPIPGWRFAVVEEGSDKPMDEKLDLSKGGVFVIHVADNGAFADQSDFELAGMDKDGQEVFRVTVTD
jgi:hypothetical protein